MINEILNKIQNIVKYAYITLASKDDAIVHQAKVQYFGARQATVNIIYPYGLAANAPKKSLVLLFSVGGQEANRVGIASDPLHRPKDLKEGEVEIGNFITKATIKFTEDGSISITASGDINVKANTVNVDASQTNLGVGGKKIALNGDPVKNNGDIVGTIYASGTNTSI